MKPPLVWAFLFGSYMNMDVLKEVDLIPEQYEVAVLYGFDIQIRPLANLVESPRHCVYGIVATATHSALQRLYQHAGHVVGATSETSAVAYWLLGDATTYLPRAVLVQTLDNQFRPALCYIAPAIIDKPASNDYIDRIVAPAREYGFPGWYIDHLESFRP